MDEDVKKYLRGEPINLEVLQDKKLKGQLAVREELYGRSAKAAAKAEKWLMPSEAGYLEPEGIEKTWRIKQEAIAREVDILSSRNQYDIVLPDLGPYTLDFTSSGRYMALAGRKGHLAIVDMKNLNLIKELQVRETVRDVVFLHNELFFAAAQKEVRYFSSKNSLHFIFRTSVVIQMLYCFFFWVMRETRSQYQRVCIGYSYIYNRDGTELHCLKEHGAALKLQFLKNHFLLASINKYGQLHYQDITTGEMVGNYRTGLGRSDVMQVNPFNSVIAVGHSGGTVSMWKPTSAAPLVKMLCHNGPITALAFHSNGHLMATAGMERKIKLWDLRKYEVLQTLPGHAKTLDFSQKGLLASAMGSSVQVLGDLSGSQNYSRYMEHSMAKGYQIQKALFRPYEDVLAIGHSMGWSSILIPGSGEPNFDTWVVNPFETSKQRREKEVKSLIDKLPPETIMLDPSKIGTVRSTRKKEKPTKEDRESGMEAAIKEAKSVTVKNKTKGRSKPSKKARKKQEAVENAKRPFFDQQMSGAESSKKRMRASNDDHLPKSLQRFVKKRSKA
nr:probable U3 small nucleolar RNA-associated protein 7 [Ipomoea batatas]